MRNVAACTSAVSASSGGRWRTRTSTPEARTASSSVSRSASPGGARGVVVAFVAHAADRRAGLGQSLARHLRDALERRPRLFGIRVDKRASRAGLHGDRAEVVADDVVDVARDPHALARGGLARLGGAQLGQAAGLVAHLREQAALLAQQVGEQQRDADDADVGDELESAEPLPRSVGGGDRRQDVADERERPERDARRRSVR